ncbi:MULTISPECIES: YggT family protein [Streptococcus]|uniref:YggT family protein n=1 Tax=Streptococcus TaxID=1301 RepID=UPI0003671C9C|nr:YggT family protein [Streptococcus entericus]
MGLVIRFLLLTLSLYSKLFIAYALLSWLPSLYDSAVGRFVRFLVDPVLAPLRRFNLQFGGLDFTVFLALLLIELASSFLSSFLY